MHPTENDLNPRLNQTSRGIVACVTTVTDEVRDDGDSNTNEEHVYHDIPSKDYALYMEVEGQEDIQPAPDAGHNTKPEIQTSNIAR